MGKGTRTPTKALPSAPLLAVLAPMLQPSSSAYPTSLRTLKPGTNCNCNCDKRSISAANRRSHVTPTLPPIRRSLHTSNSTTTLRRASSSKRAPPSKLPVTSASLVVNTFVADDECESSHSLSSSACIGHDISALRILSTLGIQGRISSPVRARQVKLERLEQAWKNGR